jgi:hypothetical protein
MNKRIVILLVFVVQLNGLALSQEWRTIRTNGVFIYKNNNAFGDYFAYRIDSVIPNGNDTILKSFPVIKKNYYDCYSPFNSSWIGKMIIIRPDGENIFINHKNDSIRINTLANIGDSWDMCDQGNVVATVTGIKDTVILGLNDSVKTITLNSTILQINGKKITLSKHYGLIRLPDFYDIPDNLYATDYASEYVYINYNLVGMSNPESGIQNLTLRDVYTYNIGDEFHRYFLNKDDWLLSNPYHENESWAIYNVLDTLHSSTTDTIKYLMKRCAKQRYYYQNSDNDSSSQTFTSFNDTIIVSLVLNNAEESDFNCLPNEPYYFDHESGFSTNHFTIHESGIIGKMTPYIDITLEDINDTCWRYPTVDACTGPNLYYKGIYGADFLCLYYNYLSQSTLVYYKKGTQAWGAPYDCATILSTGFNEQFALNKFSITPNPATDYFNISIDRYFSESMNFELFNIYGTKIKEEKISNASTAVSCSELSGGIYLFRIYNKSQILSSGKIMVLK